MSTMPAALLGLDIADLAVPAEIEQQIIAATQAIPDDETRFRAVLRRAASWGYLLAHCDLDDNPHPDPEGQS